MSLAETHNGNGAQVFITTSLEEYKKLDTYNMYYESSYGDGRRYWKYLSPRTIIGTTSMEKIELGVLSTPSILIDKMIRFTTVNLERIHDHKRRINKLDIEWTFNQVNELNDLKEFLKNHNTILLGLDCINAIQEFENTYGVTLKDFNKAFERDQNSDDPLGFDEVYAIYNNRFVLNYNLIGMDNDTNQAMLYIVKWNDYNSLKYIEERLDDFVKMSDFRVINDGEG